jgi:hypothetical protein
MSHATGAARIASGDAVASPRAIGLTTAATPGPSTEGLAFVASTVSSARGRLRLERERHRVTHPRQAQLEQGHQRARLFEAPHRRQRGLESGQLVVRLAQRVDIVGRQLFPVQRGDRRLEQRYGVFQQLDLALEAHA